MKKKYISPRISCLEMDSPKMLSASGVDASISSDTTSGWGGAKGMRFSDDEEAKSDTGVCSSLWH
jgi:hypothetical protein